MPNLCIDPAPNLVVPDKLPLTSLSGLLDWYCMNVCSTTITEARGYRVRFLEENFIHLIKLKNKFGQEPKNARLTLDEIRRGRTQLKAGRFDPQRAAELGWAVRTAREPDRICVNWKADGHSGEAYIKNWGTAREARYRVLICEIHGTIRRPVTNFSERIFHRKRTLDAGLAIKTKGPLDGGPLYPNYGPGSGSSELAFARYLNIMQQFEQGFNQVFLQHKQRRGKSGRKSNAARCLLKRNCIRGNVAI